MLPRKSSLSSKNWPVKIKAKILFRQLKIILPVLLFLLIIVGLGYFLKDDFWNIQKISCFEEENLCSADIYGDLASLVIGRHLLFLSSPQVAAKIRAKYPFLKEIKIVKKIPPELQFILKKREAMAALVKESSPDENYLVDEEGFCLKKASATDLPLVLVQELPKIAVGEKPEDRAITKAIEIIKELKLNLFEPKTAKVNPFNIEVRLEGDELTIFSTFKELKIQINSLQLILTRAKIEGKKISRLDLRFDKPVVVYD